jgi:hypothetical protein
MMTVKIVCPCGQKYAFEVEPLNGRMPRTVICPSCGADGTTAANEIIAQSLPAPGSGKAPAAGANPSAAGSTVPPPKSVRSYAAAAAAHDALVRMETRSKRNRLVMLAGGVLVLGLLAAGGWLGWKYFGPAGESPSSPGQPETVVKREPGSPNLSPQTRPGSASAPTAGVPENLRQALVLYFDFDTEPARGGTIPDRSGHGNDGRAVGVQWVRDGHRGGALKFGLTDSYLTVANKDEVNPPHLTMAAWINTAYSDAIWRRIFDKGTGQGYDLTMGGDFQGKSSRGQVCLEPGKTWAPSGIHVTDGQWHHVAGTFDGQDARVYVDGRPAGRPKHWVGELPHTPYDLTIGANRSNPAKEEVNQSFNGLMDDVMMFNRALSADEIQALFQSQGGVLGPKPAPAAPSAGTANQASPAERLKKLKDLLDQGLINQDQYNLKKKEILDAL